MAAGKPWEWTYESLGDSIDIVLELIGNVENTMKKGQDGLAPIEDALKSVVEKARKLKEDLAAARLDLYTAHKLNVTPKTEAMVVAPFRSASSTNV